MIFMRTVFLHIYITHGPKLVQYISIQTPFSILVLYFCFKLNDVFSRTAILSKFLRKSLCKVKKQRQTFFVRKTNSQVKPIHRQKFSLRFYQSQKFIFRTKKFQMKACIQTASYIRHKNIIKIRALKFSLYFYLSKVHFSNNSKIVNGGEYLNSFIYTAQKYYQNYNFKIFLLFVLKVHFSSEYFNNFIYTIQKYQNQSSSVMIKQLQIQIESKAQQFCVKMRVQLDYQFRYKHRRNQRTLSSEAHKKFQKYASVASGNFFIFLYQKCSKITKKEACSSYQIFFEVPLFFKQIQPKI
eukprot:TRINITY_DN321_c1_g1_i1.p1 TRINITY_DN321_c1_g1~~TRINITY_DN321_c1_g1_i1.p1  ORF type:complete len:297 (-),score=-15.86 TRINITY_DN321_c1_g1_i1:698-1588(-)